METCVNISQKEALSGLLQVTPFDLEKALEPMILSASGWRKVFALGGDENSLSPQISPADKMISLLMAESFSQYLLAHNHESSMKIALGMDSRHTGSLIAHLMLRVFIARGWKVDLFGIVAGPELMAHVLKSGEYLGFAYISASHNPPGHNGLKFGLNSGGVLGGSEARHLIEIFKSISTNRDLWPELINVVQQQEPGALDSLYNSMSENLIASRRSYGALNREIFSLSDDPNQQEKMFSAVRSRVQEFRIGVLGELNGSARALSIDKAFLEDLGVKVKLLGTKPGQFLHAIVPEGASLDLCREELDKAHKGNKAFSLGYVPDCDGDRGNLVYWNPKSGKSEILQAQEVFALCVLSELAGLVYSGNLEYDEEGYPQKRTSLVCNDPTSLRIERIAEAFNVHVFRAEVGEANQVTLARTLRTQDWMIRILGEGSNGGNITHPGAVRDPLSTLGSVLKLLALRSTSNKPGLFEIWCKRSGQMSLYTPDFTLQDVLESLPAFVTTSAFESRALLKIRSLNHGQLKANYEKVLVTSGWKDNADFLRRTMGIYAWEEINYEGTEEKRGYGPPFRSGSETGGFKILLKDQKGRAVGFVWMRGSGTEPVFRVMADIEGSDPFKEEWLLNWHVGMIRKAD